MINTVIFSFNRAMQLELLLQSIKRFDKLVLLDVSVFYAASSEEFEHGYAELKRTYPQFKWVKEGMKKTFVWPLLSTYWHNYYWWIKSAKNRRSSSFKTQLLEIIESVDDDYLMFLTDDSMFYQDISIPAKTLENIDEVPSASSFSFRHGSNLEGGNFFVENNTLKWNVYSPQKGDEWRYPFSVDGHIYQKEFLLKKLKIIHFNNPNSLEGHVACYSKEKKLFSTVYAGVKSSLVGFELNRVQQICNNNNLSIHPSYLNALFSKGFRLRIECEWEKNHLFRPEHFSAIAYRGNTTINILAPN
jgi:hypothetical protein